MVQHSHVDNRFGEYELMPRDTREAETVFFVQPPICEAGQDFKATLVFIDQYTNAHKVKNVVFKSTMNS